MAPSQAAQISLINEALVGAGLTPDEISYIETHGTGTPAGDITEIRALKEVFGSDLKRKQALLVGSVKSNIGHMEAAAGIAGLLKVVVSLQHQLIPANLHLKQMNPNLPFEEIPAKIITGSAYRWLASHAHPRRAGVTFHWLYRHKCTCNFGRSPQNRKRKDLHRASLAYSCAIS